MNLFLIEFTTVLIGLALSVVLFFRFPRLPGKSDKTVVYPSVSIIIPARNEENCLPLLLKDLSMQTFQALEIICVDDSSDDSTAQIASSYGAKLISLKDKPDGWTGKTWACHNGTEVAKGELFLFLDADVRLGKDGILRLVQAYLEYGSAISVQPYHKTEKIYEQFSILFNLVQIAANGTALPKPLNIGLYGPVILISQSDYFKSGGHKSARKSVVEDMTLGLLLRKAGISYRIFIGDEDIAFRMYSGGLISLLQGWTKNLATGAAKTPIPLFLAVFLWVSSITSVPLQIIKYAILANTSLLVIYSILYIVWIFLLAVLAKRIGHFKIWIFAVYPILVIAFLGVFAVSMFRKIFGLNVTWKGRSIMTRGKPCD